MLIMLRLLRLRLLLLESIHGRRQMILLLGGFL
jgi:hypothetical protein